MPVIINDFEIISERPSDTTAGARSPGSPADRSAASETPASPKTPTVLDVRRVHEHQVRRKLRLFVH
jgi:hypothetical protein